jgi:hypothetical protein
MVHSLLILAGMALEPRPVEVPAKLTAVTSQPELSGLAWSPTLGRFLVVSDDTGLKGEGTNHAPFVLAMSPDGKLDEVPVPIRGVDALNDAESICVGPKGTYFVVTSHSVDRHGRTKRARRQLLHLELDGRALIVLGRADLTELEGGSLLELAGRAAGAALDIEGLTFREGALYLGLKSPLSQSGEAVILRVEDPVPQLLEGRVRAAAVSRWASPALCVEKVCEGVADLAFLDDGSLLVVANSPKGAPPDGGGGLWRLEPGKTPALLRRFPGLKPEGLAVTSKPSLVIVFDRRTEGPLWMELPWPLQPPRR